MTATDEAFAYWEMSMLLHADTGPKVFCTEHITGPRGYRVANCTREEDHPLPHVDCHEGRVWS